VRSGFLALGSGFPLALGPIRLDPTLTWCSSKKTIAMRTFMSATLLLPALLVVTTTKAQKVADADLPAAVKSGFAQKFPGTNDARWEMEDKTTYEPTSCKAA
jgi:hypothetical protein